MLRGSPGLAAAILASSFLLGACATNTAPATDQPRVDPTVPATAVDAVPEPITPTPAQCTDDALFVEDLSLPDGTVVPAGAEIVKRWSVVNEGTCDWNEGYRLVHIDGDGLSGPDAVALFPARGGSTAVWEVILHAPEEPGTYRSVWQAQAPDGTLFGEVVYVTVVVQP